MCKYSLEGFNTKRAREGDTVYTTNHENIRGHAGGGFASSDTVRTPELVCMMHEQKITFESFDVSHIRHMREAILRSYPWVKDKIGTRQVVTMIDATKKGMPYDTLQFEDGHRIELIYVAGGLKAYVGVKEEPKTLEQKLGVDEKGIAIATLDMSDPKEPPADAPNQSDEPKQGDQEPAREPERARGFALVDYLEPINSYANVPRRWLWNV